MQAKCVQVRFKQLTSTRKKYYNFAQPHIIRIQHMLCGVPNCAKLHNI